jgi:hypothetical protein
MIPMLAEIRIGVARRRRLHLWLPLFLVWILLAALLVLLSPLILIGLAALSVCCLIRRHNPIVLIRIVGSAIVRFGGVLAALTGVHIQIQSPGADVVVRVL